MNFLNNIIEQKLLEISIQSVREPFGKLKNINRDLPILKFNEYFKTNNTGIISELKQKLLSNEKKSDRELILKLIKNLQKTGVSSFSVLTDKRFFNGSLSFLKFIKTNSSIPIIQKDFIISEYQIYQAYLNGADGIVLIAEILDYYQLKDYYQLIKELKMEAFIETHSLNDFHKVNKINPNVILVSSRNLKNMKINFADFKKFKSVISESTLSFAEGGIKSNDNYECLKKMEFNGAFLGANLMLKDNPEEIIKSYLKN